MTAGPVPAELERVRRNEQIARWNENENALAKRLVDQLAQDFAEQGKSPKAAENIQSDENVAQANNFIQWCKQKEIRSCPAKPSTVAAYIREYREHEDRADLVVAKLTAISAMHDRHGLANPCHTAVVRSVLETMFKDEAPRSWKPSEKELFVFLPAEIRLTLLRREGERDKEVRRVQSALAELRKEKSSNVESKNDEPKGTEFTGSESGASAG